MTLKKEIQDVLEELEKKQKKGFQKEIRQRMRNTEEWAQRYGKKKTPRWDKHFWSYHPEILKLVRGYYHTFGFATRITKGKTVKKGKTKHYLELYDTVARRLR